MKIDITVSEADIKSAVRKHIAEQAPTLNVTDLAFKVSRTGNGTAVVCAVEADFGGKPASSEPTPRSVETTVEPEEQVKLAETTTVSDMLNLNS